MTVNQPAAGITSTIGRSLPRWAGEIVLLVAGTAALALSAQLFVLLPPYISPVPITAQTLAVLLIGAFYGPLRAVLCIAAYLAEGACGLPVFSAGGAGPLHLVGPSGGYLVGFLGAAWLVGCLVQHHPRRSLPGMVAVMAAGTAVIFVCGMVWLTFYVGPGLVVGKGLLPFLPGATVKVGLAASVVWMWQKTAR